MRSAEPLEIDRKLRLVEIGAGGRGGKRMRRQTGSRCGGGRQSFSVERAQPIVLAPNHFLNRGFAAKRAAPTIAQWPSAEVDHVSVSVLCFDKVSVAGSLEFHVRPMARAHDAGVRMQFVEA